MSKAALKIDTVEEKPESTLRAATAAHLAGFTWDQIATRYEYSSAKAVQVAVESLIGRTFTSSDLSAARNKSLARKEQILKGLYYDATHPFISDENGEKTGERNEAHLPAVDRALRVLESIDRLLGLNAPTQIEVYRPGAEEFMETLGEIRSAMLEGQVKEGDLWDAEVVEN